MSSKKKSTSGSGLKKSSTKTKSAKEPKSSSAPSEIAAPIPVSDASSDFEAGVLFNKYDPDRTGNLTAAAFRQMWKEAKVGIKETEKNTDSNHPISTFEAGALFAKYDSDRDGRLDKKDFETMVQAHPELLHNMHDSQRLSYKNLPQEVVTGRLLTHYDETAGVAIPRSAVESHEAMGNTVHPLVEAYTIRYGRLRTLLTSKLLPRRENFLQLRRQLLNASADVEAARLAIEKETIADADRIIERLRAVESSRQSAIHHQILHLEEELAGIERLVRRVEVANDKGQNYGSSGITITPASDLHPSRPCGGHAAFGFAEAVNTPRADLMVDLIQQYTDLMANIDRLAAKQINVQVDFPTDDFPKEISDRLEILSRCDKYAHALSVKDHMLWLALKDKEKCEELLEQEKSLCKEYASEIAQWAETAQAIKNKLYESHDEMDKLRRENERMKQMLGQQYVYFAE